MEILPVDDVVLHCQNKRGGLGLQRIACGVVEEPVVGDVDVIRLAHLLVPFGFDNAVDVGSRREGTAVAMQRHVAVGYIVAENEEAHGYVVVSRRKGATPLLHAKNLEIVDDDENYEYKTVLVPKEFNSDEMLQIRLKESWYIDKQVTEQGVRILGLCLTKELFKEHDGDLDYIGTAEMFWVPMQSPQVRRLMVRNEATWQQNIADQPSWEYIFINRMFNSYVTRISNRFNRSILDYLTGTEAIWESERIESELLDISQDMWEY